MTLFDRILAGEIPDKIAYEDSFLLVIHDIAPQAPVHLLLIPKKRWKNLQDVEPEELSILAHVGKVTQELARLYKIDQGYRFLTNNGSSAGQSVFRLHFHLLGGGPLERLC